MRLKIKFLLILTLLGSVSVSAQFFQYKKLTGKVTNNELDVEGIHVINKTSKASTITDATGNFEIGVRLNDTLVFSAIQYKIEILIISKDIFEKGYVEINLTEKINELEEVVITPHRLSGNLANDMKKAEVKPDINFYDVGIPGFKGKREEKIVPIIPSIGTLMTVNIEALYKNLSGYYKKLRVRRGWDKENEAVIKIINFYGLGLFTDTFHLPEEQIYPFVLSCVASTDMESDFNKQNHHLVLQVFEEKAKDFKN